MSHTPGPWRLVFVEKEDEMFCDKYDIMIDGDTIGTINIWVNGPEEAKANANLIVAAPELLKALQKLKKIIGIWWPGSVPEQVVEAIKAAHAAIAKAKGQN